MLEQWISDPGKVGATAMLLAAIGALYWGKIVPRWTYDAMLSNMEKQLARREEDCNTLTEMNKRMLEQAQRRDEIAAATAEAAIKATKARRS